MKHKIRESKTGFRPIKLSITIESIDELADIASRLDVDTQMVSKECGALYDLSNVNKYTSYDLWETLSGLYNKLKK